MPLLKWTSRQFYFDLPPQMMPFIVERLAGTAARIEEMTKDLSEEELKRKIDERWTILEHIGHLIDLDDLHDGRIDDYIAAKRDLRPADMENRRTYAAGHNERKLTDLISEFRTKRNAFIERLLDLPADATSIHPRLKKAMRVVDMAFFVAEHDDHHLANMRELI